MSEGVQRKLAAIVSADVAGYTRMMQANEAGTHARLQKRYRDLVAPSTDGHGGRIVKLMGDGLLAEFPSVVNAVEWAVDVQTGNARRNAETPPDQRIVYRIGINLGDVIVDGDDLFGDGVNVAARLQEIADEDGICLSDDAHRQVRGKTGAAFDDGGTVNLKNVTGPVRVWRWTAQGAAGQAVLALPDKPSIAVLPFDNMSGDPEQAYLADGISEDIITELSRFRSLFVIARNSSFTYKGQATDVQRIAAELGVRYILEGSVRKGGNRIRVTAQLIDAPSRAHVWAERYDRELEDLFALQDEITRTIVAALEPEMSSAERDRARRTPPDSLDAWGLYQRGLWHAYRFTASDNAEARSLFERATAADPNFAPAFAGLSLAYFSNAYLGYEGDRDRFRTLALEAAQRAVALDDRDETARWALGRAYMIGAQQNQAIAEFETAIELNPNYAHAHYNLGWSLVLAGRSAESLSYLDTAERLSPHDPLQFAICAVRAHALILTDDLEAALIEAQRSARHPNTHANSRAPLVSVLGLLGRTEEARAELANIIAERPDYSCREYILSFPFQNQGDLDTILSGLTAAGVPE